MIKRLLAIIFLCNAIILPARGNASIEDMGASGIVEEEFIHEAVGADFFIVGIAGEDLETPPLWVPRQIEACLYEGISPEDPAKEIPLVINKKVEDFVSYFQTRGRDVFVRWLERSPMYLPLINGILVENGLSEDLAYLALIESGFNPNARSRSNAVGVWQFIPSTAKLYGLRVDWWIDERKDVEKATFAAARYLKNLYAIFDSWYLAAAGYNAGEGKILRAIKKQNTEDFWEIASQKKLIKKETKDYIPKYLAAMMIAKEPHNYGFTELNYREPVQYEKVNIPAATDVKLIADAVGITVEELRSLNPELKTWFTPPNYPLYEIKLPYGTADILKEKMKEFPKERVKFHTHKVKRAETLSQIARRYGIGVEPIMYINNIKNVRHVRDGSTIMVPVRAMSQTQAAKAVKTQSAKGEKKHLPAKIYTVKKGDTLWGISMRFGVEIERLLELNDLNNRDDIKQGQRLFLKEALLHKDKGGKIN